MAKDDCAGIFGNLSTSSSYHFQHLTQLTFSKGLPGAGLVSGCSVHMFIQLAKKFINQTIINTFQRTKVAIGLEVLSLPFGQYRHYFRLV